VIRRVAIVLCLVLLAACGDPSKPGKVVKKSVDTSCGLDTAGIRAAQETYRAANADGNYATTEQLSPGFLSAPSTLHRITDVVAADPANGVESSYKIRVAHQRCGATTDTLDANLVDKSHPNNL
jgi:hypothetical protein